MAIWLFAMCYQINTHTSLSSYIKLGGANEKFTRPNTIYLFCFAYAVQFAATCIYWLGQLFLCIHLIGSDPTVPKKYRSPFSYWLVLIIGLSIGTVFGIWHAGGPIFRSGAKFQGGKEYRLWGLTLMGRWKLQTIYTLTAWHQGSGKRRKQKPPDPLELTREPRWGSHLSVSKLGVQASSNCQIPVLQVLRNQVVVHQGTYRLGGYNWAEYENLDGNGNKLSVGSRLN